MAKTTSQYRAEIEATLDTLQALLESNRHLDNPEVYPLLNTLSTRWTFLSGEDQEYVQAATTAIEEGIAWNV